MVASNESDERYGIVIDSGSSGSRVHIYKWRQDRASAAQEALRSVPAITQEKDWTRKVTPGLSSYEQRPGRAFAEHIRPLLEYAKQVVPAEAVKRTPVFIQGTAGMRLLPADKQQRILENVCQGLRRSTGFLVEDCGAQVQVIDGETEGLYGWLALNYLSGHFDNYDTAAQEHASVGFMDMGGASTQIAFAPSDAAEVRRHRDDIATVYLRSMNGELQQWDVFVSTWLGFGANQARKRYLVQLLNALPENANDYDADDYVTKTVADPCMPKGCERGFTFKKQAFTAVGSGNYEQCVRMIYPLLLKNLPCSDEPCLFNGVHAPRIDFYRDKFVGVSEYWYTANDVFKLGGDYSFEAFSRRVQEFCDSEWAEVKAKSDSGAYNAIPESIVKDACFKGSWVLNVLHEGFGLPRIGVEGGEGSGLQAEQRAPAGGSAFHSAENVAGRDLSWTLGKMLLYASSGIAAAGGQEGRVGIMPSSNDAAKLGRQFLPGAIARDTTGTGGGGVLARVGVLVLVLVAALVWMLLTRRAGGKLHLVGSLRSGVRCLAQRLSHFHYSKVVGELPLWDLEAGRTGDAGAGDSDERWSAERDRLKLRSKSMFNLHGGGRSTNGGRQHASPRTGSSGAGAPPAPAHPAGSLRTAFSLADFSKFSNDKSYD